MNKQLKKIYRAKEFILGKLAMAPDIGIVLGSGLGGIAEKDNIEIDTIIDYSQIPEFPVSTIKGHKGSLVAGKIENKNVIIMNGRFHYYEGHNIQTLAFPVRVLRYIGISALIVTNAAGGLNTSFEPGDIMLITDHINMSCQNPLIGENCEDIGPRFPDMSNAYDKDMRKLAIDTSNALNIPLKQGIYAFVTGPSYETPAERRFLSNIGADAVGMSTVPEVIAANHCSIKVLGMSLITNKARGSGIQTPDSHDKVIKAAKEAGPKLVSLVKAIIKGI